MEKLVKRHGLWTMVMIVAWIMCVVTGHQMVHALKESKDTKEE